MTQFVKISKTIKKTQSNKKIKNIDINKSFLKSFRDRLNSSILDEDDWVGAIEALYLNKKETYYKLLKKISVLLRKNLENNQKSAFYENLSKIKEVFRLDDNEVEIITFLFLIENDEELEDAFKHNSQVDMDNIIKSIRLYCRFFDIKPKKMRDYLSKDSKLIKSGILNKRHNGLMISDYIEAYLAGISRMDIIENFFKKEIIDNSIDVKDHIVPIKNTNSIIDLLTSKKGSNILLYGKPGTGKTEFAKSLAQSVGLPIYFINQYDEEGEEDLSHRKSAIVAAQNIIEEKSIIVVDECDPIINTQDNMWLCEEPKSKNDSKAWINFTLEKTKHNIIWITNKTDSIDISTKRRFSFSQEFKDLTKKQRKKVWEIVSQKNEVNYLNSREISELAEKFKVNAGGISLAIQDINSMKSLDKKSDKKILLENILKQHERLVFGKTSKLVSKNKLYSSKILNLDHDPNKIVKKMGNFLEHIRENPLNSEIQNMNLLFYGPPGTGKTEFVKHLAEKLGVEINLKRLSDIRSKWYGESLKKISSIFEETEGSEKILFLDEADTFFIDRENSSDEYYREETNELLTQMENFKGVLICSTNLLGNLDQAVMRRFTFKISFDYLTKNGKQDLFKKFFPKVVKKSDEKSILKKLDKIQFLTPGDFKVVQQKHFFDDYMDINNLIDALNKESLLKKVGKRKIGFS